MTPTVAALAWAAVVSGAAAVGLRPRVGPDPGGRAARPRNRALLRGLGIAAARGGARVVGRPPSAPADPGAIGAGVVLGVAVVIVLPSAWPVGLVLGGLPPLVAGARRRRAQVAAARAVQDELPEVIDLLALAVAAGLTTALAVAAVGRRGRGVLAAALASAGVAAAKEDRRLADVLYDLPLSLGAVGDVARPLVAALADSARHGTALGSTLDRLAVEARISRRHRAEERARRVPILLLFPLVTCTLPALGLLSIAPLAVGAIRDLRA